MLWQLIEAFNLYFQLHWLLLPQTCGLVSHNVILGLIVRHSTAKSAHTFSPDILVVLILETYLTVHGHYILILLALVDKVSELVINQLLYLPN